MPDLAFIIFLCKKVGDICMADPVLNIYEA